MHNLQSSEPSDGDTGRSTDPGANREHPELEVRAIAALRFHLGLRAAEVASLEIDDLQYRDRTVLIRLDEAGRARSGIPVEPSSDSRE